MILQVIYLTTFSIMRIKVIVLIGTNCEYLFCDFNALSSCRANVCLWARVGKFSHNFKKWKRGNCSCHLVSKQITIKRDIRDILHNDMLHALRKGDTSEAHQIYAAVDMNFTWIYGFSFMKWKWHPMCATMNTILYNYKLYIIIKYIANKSICPLYFWMITF